MILAVSYLQLAARLSLGIAGVLDALRVDSCNDLTRRPIPGAAKRYRRRDDVARTYRAHFGTLSKIA